MLDINGTYYMANMVRWTRSRDIIMGLSKAFCFGILIVFISCQKGLTTREGAVGVGRPDNRIHAPNENIQAADYINTVRLMCRVWERFGAS